MKRVRIYKPGDYKELKIESFDPKEIKPNEILIETYAVGINYADICVRWGVYDSAKKYVGWPITPGFESSGKVIKVGKEVGAFQPGDEVIAISRFDSYATHVVAPEHQVFLKPKNIDFFQAAGLPGVYLTAYHALFQNVVIRPNSKILIHSAAGGVGSALVQMAKLKGHKVVGIIGNPIKKEYVTKLGADLVISKQEVDWVQAAKKFSPDGFDIILDANGQSTLMDSYNLLAPIGKLISYGFHSMLPKKGGKLNWPKLIYTYLKTPKFNPVHMTSKNKSLVTFNLSFLFDQKEILKEGMNEILKWIEDEKINPPRTTVYKFKDVAQAHRDMESGNTMGKLILDTL